MDKKKPYSVFLQLSANCVQNKAGSRKKPNRLFTLAHLKEKFLDVTVELLGQTQSLCKLCLWETHNSDIIMHKREKSPERPKKL